MHVVFEGAVYLSYVHVYNMSVCVCECRERERERERKEKRERSMMSVYCVLVHKYIYAIRQK
jgi:hypothetical protein